ncbi:MAG: hypothetical protein SP1CHLAM54_03290 [Chlamydiia bacterium]|nr:hypothetical protein [Chlamydiia bacterium]MCH9615245.1 hypothetical protein [Chlamydiia bacterium]MCH9628433.1 hypothetical protein [Chlamydiia bacterium]
MKNFLLIVLFIIVFGVAGLIYGYFHGTQTKAGPKPYLLVLKRGDNVLERITKHLEDEGLDCCSVSGLGAIENPKIAYYNLKLKRYLPRTFEGMYELASLNGNFIPADGHIVPHVHVVIGNEKYQTFAGHLMGGTVGATLELTIVPLKDDYERVEDKAIGLKLIQED